MLQEHLVHARGVQRPQPVADRVRGADEAELLGEAHRRLVAHPRGADRHGRFPILRVHEIRIHVRHLRRNVRADPGEGEEFRAAVLGDGRAHGLELPGRGRDVVGDDAERRDRERDRAAAARGAYFRGGKEDLLLAVARFEAEQVIEDQQPYLSCLDSWEAWEQWREAAIRRYEEQGDRCPLAALSQHLGSRTPGAQAIVVGLMDRWQEHLAAGIRALQQAGHLPREVDVDERAAALLVAIQGGVGILQSTGRSYHLRVALDHAIGDLHRLADQRPAALAAG